MPRMVNGAQYTAVSVSRANGQTPVLLTWDESVAAAAQAWADELQAQSGADQCRMHHDAKRGKQGENLAWNWGSTATAAARTPEQVMVAWWDDEEKEALAGCATHRIGHFTQAAWYGTTKVGCGSFTNPQKGGGRCHVQVCRYVVPGNCNVPAALQAHFYHLWLLPAQINLL